ncbi:hypothetical protein AAGG74_14490 [Bacillus mexicanus]|uniref:hypothetical protein n=1 Tax=Bacillus mexicanus TaxID=2834415 RepID=UPI003D23E32D
MFFFEEKADKKPKEIAEYLNTTSEKVSEWAKDLERYGILKFTKTAYGALLFKESEIKILREYGMLKTALGNPKDAIDIIKESEIIPKDTEDMSWTKKLNNAIWRRH